MITEASLGHVMAKIKSDVRYDVWLSRTVNKKAKKTPKWQA